MGGLSSEREISIKSGMAVLEALKRQGVEAFPVILDGDVVEKVLNAQMDLAFLALHGKLGEDGTIQGLLELLRIPYTGSGVLGSALAMDKVKAKQIFLASGIPTPEFVVWEEGMSPTFPLPWVVKPVSEGSTIGVSIVREEAELESALSKALEYDSEVFIERFIPGKELTVAVLNGRPLEVIEILPEGGFYDFERKYTPGKTQYLIPAPIGEELRKRAKELAVLAYKALKCSGCIRVDFRLDPEGGLWVLEVNTIPGMTATSLVPRAASYEGLSFDELVLEILKGASLKVKL
jgi:D-alanine-D-alanine ligase